MPSALVTWALVDGQQSTCVPSLIAASNLEDLQSLVGIETFTKTEIIVVTFGLRVSRRQLSDDSRMMQTAVLTPLLEKSEI